VDPDSEEESDKPVGIPFFRSSFCRAVSVDVSPSRLHQSLNSGNGKSQSIPDKHHPSFNLG